MNDLSLRTRGYFKFLTNCPANKREWTRAVLILHRDPKNAVITADLQDTEYETLDLPDTKIVIQLSLFKICRKHAITIHTSTSEDCSHSNLKHSPNSFKTSTPCYQIHLSSRFLFGKKQLWLGFITPFDQDIWYSALKTLLSKHGGKKNILSGPDAIQASALSLSQTSELDLLASALPNILDNEIYESTSTPDTFSVCIIHTEKSKDLGLSGRYLLRLKESAFELLDPDTYSIVRVWPIKYVRKFGTCYRLKKWIIEQVLKKESEEFHLTESNNCWFSSEPRKKRNIITSPDLLNSRLITKPRASSVNEFILQNKESLYPNSHQYSSNMLPKEISVSLAYDSDVKSSSSSWLFPDDNFLSPNGKCFTERSCQTLFGNDTSEHSKHLINNNNSPCISPIRQQIQEQNTIDNNFGSQETFISETLCDQENNHNNNDNHNNLNLEEDDDDDDDDTGDFSGTSQPVYANAEQITNTIFNAKTNQIHKERILMHGFSNVDETVVTSCSMDVNSSIPTIHDTSTLSLLTTASSSTSSTQSSSSSSTLSNKPINTLCSLMRNWRLGRSIEPIVEKEEQNSHNSSLSLGNDELNSIYKGGDNDDDDDDEEEECDGLVTSSTPDNHIDIKELNNHHNDSDSTSKHLNYCEINDNEMNDSRLMKEGVHSTNQFRNILEDVKFYRLVSRSATWDGWMKLTTNTKQEIQSQTITQQDKHNTENDNHELKNDSNIIVMTAF
ncbi:unnamed protein product [Heterobilharzia americana]|nr:unnamed protein product [Heterobilharzia americana]